jgi:hypothetical protein
MYLSNLSFPEKIKKELDDRGINISGHLGNSDDTIVIKASRTVYAILKTDLNIFEDPTRLGLIIDEMISEIDRETLEYLKPQKKKDLDNGAN